MDGFVAFGVRRKVCGQQALSVRPFSFESSATGQSRIHRKATSSYLFMTSHSNEENCGV
jgi:hypothetical protein